jgi:glycosyltransferase involved in cell wall biosynthesis
MLSNAETIGRGTGVAIRNLEIGPKLSTRTWRSLIVRWPWYLGRFARALRRELPYDVLLLHYKKEQLMATALPGRLRQAVVWAEWGPVPFPMRRGAPRVAYVSAARRAKLIMAVSEGTRRSVHDVGVPADKVVHVPNVVDVEDIRFRPEGRAAVRERLGIPEDAFVVGCISRFHPKKRNDVVVDAVIQLDDPGTHLIMAGEGETEVALRAQAAPLNEHVHFIETPRGYVADVLSAFDVSVFCPSPTEGAPRATILAMLASRPCLATGPEGVADLIRPGFGTITQPPDDPAALRDVLREYRHDPERRRREGDAARGWAKGVFAAPIVAARIEELLSSAAAQ